MKLSIFALLFLAILPYPITSASSGLVHQKYCLMTADFLMVRWSRMLQLWLAEEESGYHVFAHVDRLSSEHVSYLTAIEDFVQEVGQVEDSVGPLTSMIGRIDHVQLGLSSRFPLITQNENLLTADMRRLAIGLALWIDRAQRTADRCSASVTALLEQNITVAKQFQSKLEEGVSYLSQARHKRVQLLHSVLQVLRMQTKKRIARILQRDIDNVISYIDKGLMMDKFYGGYLNWETGLRAKGFANHLEWKSYEFSKALEIMELNIYTTKQYLEALDKFEMKGEPIDDLIRSSILNTLKFQDRSYQRLVELGWQGQLARQLDAIDHQRSLSSTQDCADAIDSFLAVAKTIRTSREFDAMPPLYLQALDKCKGDNP